MADDTTDVPAPTAPAPASRSLGFVSTTALVVANMVGTGIFTTSVFLLADLKSPWQVLGVSLVGGVLAALGALSYGATAGPRVCARMAEDRYLPACLTARNAPPVNAILLQSVLALTLLWSSTFDLLLTYIGFTLGLSAAATVVGLIRVRLREGSQFRVPGWPCLGRSWSQRWR